jgi:hypothetical protein
LQSVNYLPIFKLERQLVAATLIGLRDALKGPNAQYKKVCPSLAAAFDADTQVVIADANDALSVFQAKPACDCSDVVIPNRT